MISSSAYTTSSMGDEESSSFLGGYPMLPSRDPLFRAFSPLPFFGFNHSDDLFSTNSYSSGGNTVNLVDDNTVNLADDNTANLVDSNTVNLADSNTVNINLPASSWPEQVDSSVNRDPPMVSDPEVYPLADDSEEVFARKVFIGGLPFDISAAEIMTTFSQFGPMIIDWPYRSDVTREQARRQKGYVFIVFEEERSVRRLVDGCYRDGEDYFLLISSPTMKKKPVQVRAWRLSDACYMLCSDMKIDARRTVFIGGVPRPTVAGELARLLEQAYGKVCFASVDIDPELKYPKGAARVTFATTAGYLAAIKGRFVNIHCAGITRRVEIKPYVVDEQMCDECDGALCSNRYASYFCGDILCLQYFCEVCWHQFHSTSEELASHRPFVRRGEHIKVLLFVRSIIV
ncbi:unnamed protein product [Toxocara canis]|uniref:Cytoplasmic polyadenylation element-binding protein 1 n=1 Tax=Toxocara canis TaxID=6265 RepID=A0A183V6Q6_TOXCA|nr:unnamed protein product [Toxocara canis]